jgi:hypothetical protein
MNMIEIPRPAVDMVEGQSSRTQLMIEALEVWEIETPAQEAEAGRLLVGIVADRKRIDDQRTAITKPLNESKRAVDAFFAPVLGALKQAEDLLRCKVADAVQRREDANRAALDAARLASETGEGSIAEAIARVVDAPALPGVSIREVWMFEIVDAKQVPSAYLKVNESLVHEAIKTGVREIPGLRIYAHKATTVRTKK